MSGKRLARGFASAAFKACLLLAAFTAAMAVTFGTSVKIKESLAKSGLYEHIIDSVLNQAEHDTPEQQGETGVAFDNQVVRDVAKQTVTPKIAQDTVEEVIDGTYRWLDGSVKEPDFQIDLGDLQQKLATNLADAGFKRMESLPVCTQEQLAQMSPELLTDIFSLPCRPPRLNMQAERQKILDKVSTNGELAKSSTVTTEDLRNQQGESPFQKLSKVPDAFQYLKWLPWIFLGLAILSGIGVFLLHDERRRGMFVIARTLAVAGGLLLLGALVTAYLIDKIQPTIGPDEPGIQQASIDVARLIASQLNRVLFYFGAGYGILGGGGLLGLHFTKPKPGSLGPDLGSTNPNQTAPPADPKSESAPATQTAAPKDTSQNSNRK